MNHMPPVFPTFKPTFNNAHAWRMADRPNLGGFSAKPCKRKDKGCSTAAWLGSSECRWPKICRKSMIHNLLKSSIFKSLGCVSFTFPHTRPTKSAGLPESAEKKKTPARVFPINYGQRYRRALYSNSCLRMASCSQDFGQTCATQEHR